MGVLYRTISQLPKSTIRFSNIKRFSYIYYFFLLFYYFFLLFYYFFLLFYYFSLLLLLFFLTTSTIFPYYSYYFSLLLLLFFLTTSAIFPYYSYYFSLLLPLFFHCLISQVFWEFLNCIAEGSPGHVLFIFQNIFEDFLLVGFACFFEHPAVAFLNKIILVCQEAV
jgi:hypothetical protein